jgi:hypothetical protein
LQNDSALVLSHPSGAYAVVAGKLLKPRAEHETSVDLRNLDEPLLFERGEDRVVFVVGRRNDLRRRHKTVFAEQDAHDLAQRSLPVHPVPVEHVGLALGNKARREIAMQSARVGDELFVALACLGEKLVPQRGLAFLGKDLRPHCYEIVRLAVADAGHSEPKVADLRLRQAEQIRISVEFDLLNRERVARADRDED